MRYSIRVKSSLSTTMILAFFLLWPQILSPCHIIVSPFFLCPPGQLSLLPRLFLHLQPFRCPRPPPSHQTLNPYLYPIHRAAPFSLRFRLRKNITGAFPSTRHNSVVSGLKWFLIDSILPVASALSVLLIRSLCAWWSVFSPLVNNRPT